MAKASAFSHLWKQQQNTTDYATYNNQHNAQHHRINHVTQYEGVVMSFDIPSVVMLSPVLFIIMPSVVLSSVFTLGAVAPK